MQDARHLAGHPANNGVPAARGAEWAPRGQWLAPVPIEDAMAAPTAPADAAVEVYANHGRWVVECPDCHGAQFACRTDARFMCNECGNAAVDGGWRPAVWPAEADAIEADLHRRPKASQNWRSDTSLEDLRRETDAGLAGAFDGRAER